jgi:hypothetical protein
MNTEAKVDVSKLKDMTRRAIEAGQAEAKRLAEQVAEKERLKKAQDELKAKRIIMQIPGRAEKEAALGRSHAIVMAVKYEDYDRPRDTPAGKDWRVCQGDWLKGACKLVWEYCVEAELNPTLEDWHDGCGINSGHNIVIHW